MPLSTQPSSEMKTLSDIMSPRRERALQVCAHSAEHCLSKVSNPMELISDYAHQIGPLVEIWSLKMMLSTTC